MRKIGIVCAILGALTALGLGYLQTTAWFAAQVLKPMSEAEEFVVSFFWAGILLGIVGLVLVVRSTYVHDDEATFEDYLPAAEAAGEELIWICPRCGTENPDEAAFCTNCGWQDGTSPDEDPDPDGNWICPVCGCVWGESASVCTNCGYRRFE